jgi:hypothetical protein
MTIPSADGRLARRFDYVSATGTGAFVRTNGRI